MSRTSFDTLAKDLAVDLLASLGRVESDLRIVAEPQFADREVIEQIVAQVKTKNYGFRTLVHEIVQSRPFKHK